MSEQDIAKQDRKYGVRLRFAQGPKSEEFKSVLKQKIAQASTDQELNVLLDDIHDAVLAASNSYSSLSGAIDRLKS